MALCGGIVLEEALDLSFDRLLMMIFDENICYYCNCVFSFVVLHVYGCVLDRSF